MTIFFIFDLDGTLYSFKHTGIGLQMRGLINSYLADQYKLTPEEANAMADEGYQKYGLTARAIQCDHKATAEDVKKYCGYVHQVDLSHIKYNPKLVEAMNALAKVPGAQCWVMTNAIKMHAMASLAQMGITEAFRDPKTGCLRVVDCFDQWACSTDDHIAICKPLKEAYDFMIQQVGADAKRDKFVLVEDSMKNLEEPQKMGWRTVFLTDERDSLNAQAMEHGHIVHTSIMDAIPDLLAWAKNENDLRNHAEDDQ